MRTILDALRRSADGDEAIPRMTDFRGRKVYAGDIIVYVTLSGHKPILRQAEVLLAEETRVKIRPITKRYGEIRKDRYLHQPENFTVISS